MPAGAGGWRLFLEPTMCERSLGDVDRLNPHRDPHGGGQLAIRGVGRRGSLRVRGIAEVRGRA